MDRRVVPGLVLIALGVLFLLFQQVGVGGEAVVAVIGLVLLAGYAYTRNYGFLIPGGIMTGLGMGIILAARSPGGGSAVLLGLGLGFLCIYVIDAPLAAHARGMAVDPRRGDHGDRTPRGRG